MAGNGKLPLHARFLALHVISPIRKARECDSEKHTYYMYARENVCNSVIAHTDYMCGNGTGANARGNVCNSAIAQRATLFCPCVRATSAPLYLPVMAMFPDFFSLSLHPPTPPRRIRVRIRIWEVHGDSGDVHPPKAERVNDPGSPPLVRAYTSLPIKCRHNWDGALLAARSHSSRTHTGARFPA